MLEIETMMVHPKRAMELLENGRPNRPLSEHEVQRLRAEMDAGRWWLNGQSLIFNEAGQMIDGQHRCWAVVRHGKPVEMSFVTGVRDGAFATIDTGRVRGIADLLGLRGFKNSSMLSAAVRQVIINMPTTEPNGSAPHLEGRPGRRASITPGHAEAFLESHPGIVASVEYVRHFEMPRGLMSAALVAALHYIFSRFDKEAADVWARDLIVGAGLESDDPVFALRERLMANRAAPRKLSLNYITAIAIKSWNARRAGRRVKILKLNFDEATPQAI